jgi:hypothetical protein
MRTSPTSEERLGLVRRHEIVNPMNPSMVSLAG